MMLADPNTLTLVDNALVRHAMTDTALRARLRLIHDGHRLPYVVAYTPDGRLVRSELPEARGR